MANYNEFYLSRRIAKAAGVGKRMWLLKLPRQLSVGGASLLGTVVEELGRGPFEVNYPAPYHYMAPQLVLKQLEAKRAQLHLPAGDVFHTDKLANAAFTLTRGTDLKIEAGSNIPGVPVSGTLGVDYSATTSVVYTLGEDTRVEYIATGDLSKLAKLLGGDSRKLDPSSPVDIDDNLIVDQLLIARNYKVSYKQSSKITANLQAEVEEIGEGKLTLTHKSDYSFELSFQGDTDYVIGFKTIDWDDLDW